MTFGAVFQLIGGIGLFIYGIIPSMSVDDVPNNSVLREFIGGTCYEEVEK